MNIDAWYYQRKVNNYIVDATDTGTGNDKFNSTTLQKYTVPDNKRWFVLGGISNRDASSTITIRLMSAADKPLKFIQSRSAATGTAAWPNNDTATGTTQHTFPIIADGGEYIQVDFGSAQGAGAYLTCVVIEVDL